MSDFDAGAPPCPWWCTEQHDDGWVAAGGELTKQCRRRVFADSDVDGVPAELELGRFAYVVDGRVFIADPTVRLFTSAALSVASALTLAATIDRLSEMIGEPRTAAA